MSINGTRVSEIPKRSPTPEGKGTHGETIWEQRSKGKKSFRQFCPNLLNILSLGIVWGKYAPPPTQTIPHSEFCNNTTKQNRKEKERRKKFLIFHPILPHWGAHGCGGGRCLWWSGQARSFSEINFFLSLLIFWTFSM
jgi:hypothetical protein